MTRFKNIPPTCHECGSELRGNALKKYHLKCRIKVERRSVPNQKTFRADATVGSHRAYENMITGHNK
jgi:hypothetical protein